MGTSVRHTVIDGIAVVTADNPPVNALSHAVRKSLLDCLEALKAYPHIEAVVLCCEGKTFFAGADIREFAAAPQQPHLFEIVDAFEAFEVPVVAAIHGTALGGGLEVALGAHYRIATRSAKLGLPEVNLGLLPGAGGTQRLPRLIGIEEAARLITKGAQVSADHAKSIGLVDEVVEDGDARAAGIEFAQQLITAAAPVRRTRALSLWSISKAEFSDLSAETERNARGVPAPSACLEALEAAISLPFEQGLARERELFVELKASPEHQALRHAFFAEREVGKLPMLRGVEARPLDEIGIVGGGTMGVGIAASALSADLKVCLIELDAAAAERASTAVYDLLSAAVERGKMSVAQFEAIKRDRFSAHIDYSALGDADVVIEAVYESMDAKRDVFNKLDSVCKPGAILASNTSYLNIDEIAAVTARPGDVLGLHFFSPAHLMRLLEVVVGEATSAPAVATGFALAKRLKKIAVHAGVCDGFIGNRILSLYLKAINSAVLQGASPFEVDRALTEFGLAMGPFSVSDLAGLDIGWANRKRLAPKRNPDELYAEFADKICEMGRFGQKTGRGFYVYEKGTKQGKPDPEVDEIIAEERRRKSIVPRGFPAQEIVDRYMAAMVNEAAKVVEEGIALRPLDVDVTLLNGYGFPRWRGGPMHYADHVGIGKVLNDIKRFQNEDGQLWRPAALLEQLVSDGKEFATLNAA